MTAAPAGTRQWSALSFTLRGPRIAGIVGSPSVDAAYFQTQTYDGSFRVTRLRRVGGGEVPVPAELGCYAHALLADGTLVLLGRGRGGGVVATLDPRTGTVIEVWRCPGTVLSLTAASAARLVVLKVKVMPDAADLADDVWLREVRREAGTSAILHEGLRIHQHDVDLGPDEPRLFRLDLRGEPAVTDLTPWAGRGLRDQAYAVSPDGRHVAVSVLRERPGPVLSHGLVLVDTATGTHRPLTTEPHLDLHEPAFFPDGRRIACVAAERSTAHSPTRHWLTVVDITTGARTDLPNDAALIPRQVRVDPAGRVLFVADHHGHSKLFAADGDTAEPTPLTRTGAVVDYAVTGRGVHAILSTPVRPPRVVRLGARVRVLHEEAPEGAGTSLHRVGCDVDGVRLGAWLALPADVTGPLPVAVFLHGGPIASWTGWLWGWNPTVLTDDGWAVLLPDPALSSGYGQGHLDRGWGAWDRAPVTDTLALLDAALAQFAALDPTRMAVAGGSFGGYLAMRLLRRGERFRCGVAQATPFDLPSFVASSDAGHYFRRELSDTAVERTGWLADLPPVLLTHGARDRRVPISQALHVWQELNADAPAAERGHQFLYFPDEGHSIRRPGNLEVWYRTLRRFLNRHVRGIDSDDPLWL